MPLDTVEADETLADVVTAFLSIIRTLDALADATEGSAHIHVGNAADALANATEGSAHIHVGNAADALAASDFLSSIMSARVALIGRG